MDQSRPSLHSSDLGRSIHRLPSDSFLRHPNHMRAHLHEAGGQVEAADDERATDREWGPVPEEELLLFVHTGNEGDN